MTDTTTSAPGFTILTGKTVTVVAGNPVNQLGTAYDAAPLPMLVFSLSDGGTVVSPTLSADCSSIAMTGIAAGTSTLTVAMGTVILVSVITVEDEVLAGFSLTAS